MKTLNLNKTSKMAIGLVITLALLGFAGTADRVEEVIYNMPDAAYHEIKSKLSEDGVEATDYQIANYYIKHYARK